MLARTRTAHEDEGGFTLIELLVVMIIIGVLAAIAIPAFLSQKKKGYEAGEKSDLRSIATEISTQLVDNPATLVLAQTGTAVTVTPATGAAGSINLSPGTTLGLRRVTTTNGTYCVGLTNPGAGVNWYITNGLATATSTGSQTLSSTACT